MAYTHDNNIFRVHMHYKELLHMKQASSSFPKYFLVFEIERWKQSSSPSQTIIPKTCPNNVMISLLPILVWASWRVQCCLKLLVDSKFIYGECLYSTYSGQSFHSTPSDTFALCTTNHSGSGFLRWVQNSWERLWLHKLHTMDYLWLVKSSS